MTDSVGPTSRTLPYCLLGASAILLTLQVWHFAQWKSAFEMRHTQGERVSYYLEHLPFGLGGLGTTNLTLLSAAVGAVACAIAFLGGRHHVGPVRATSIGLVALNALLVLWYLFTLM